MEEKKIVITNQNYDYEDTVYREFYKCPNCENTDVIEGFNYCPNCGYEIEWNVENTEDLINTMAEDKKYVFMIIKKLNETYEIGLSDEEIIDTIDFVADTI